jgi:GTP cyclohydrolase I
MRQAYHRRVCVARQHDNVEGRTLHQFAHQLQLQERLTHRIADAIQRVTASDDVMVVGRGQHLCMSMRGIKTNAIMANSVVRGRFRELPAIRAEALSLMGL